MKKLEPKQEARRVVKCIIYYCKEYGIEINYAFSIASKETNGKTDIIKLEGKGINNLVFGIYQLKYGTAIMMGFKGDPAELLDTETNIKYALKYLQYCLIKHDDNLLLASAMYNAGSIKRDNMGRIKNRSYISRVLKIKELIDKKKVTKLRVVSAWFIKVPELYGV